MPNLARKPFFVLFFGDIVRHVFFCYDARSKYLDLRGKKALAKKNPVYVHIQKEKNVYVSRGGSVPYTQWHYNTKNPRMSRETGLSDDGEIDVSYVRGQQETHRICQGLVDVMGCEEGSKIRPVRRAGLDKFKGILRKGGFDLTRCINVYSKAGLEEMFFETVEARRQKHVDNNIPIPVGGIFFTDQDVLNGIKWSIDDGAHRVSACRELYAEHAEKFPDKVEERDKLYKYVKATIYRKTIEENGEIIG